MNIFFEIHQDLPREAPGDNASTRRALALMTHLPAQPRVLDIGCGPGMQTIEIAKQTKGCITAIDTHEPFIDILKQRATTERVAEHITAQTTSMFELNYPNKSWDVIWSEGAIYIIGFEKGLRTWQRFLKHSGYIAITELSWLKANPPQEVKRFWANDYPEMKSLEENLKIIETTGYKNIAHFVLPESSWWDNYYSPLEKRVAQLRQKYQADEEAQKQLDETQREFEMYRHHSAWYGYVFYVMQLL